MWWVLILSWHYFFWNLQFVKWCPSSFGWDVKIEKNRLLVFNFLSSRCREGTKRNIEIRILLVWLVCRRELQLTRKSAIHLKIQSFLNLASQLVFLIEKYRLLVFNFPSSRFREGTKGNIEIRILLVWLVCRTELIPEIMCYWDKDISYIENIEVRMLR